MQKNNFNAIRSTTIAKPAISVLNLTQIICASINTRVGKMRIFIRIFIRIHCREGHVTLPLPVWRFWRF